MLSLRPADSTRLNGEDKGHIVWLGETETIIPLILVDRRTVRVIDGMRRLAAASLQGRESIEVIFFDGSEAGVFMRAVQGNVTHGLPLLQDPSLRYNERGKEMLWLLHYNAIGAGQLPDIATVVPPHRVPTVMQLARQYAKMWPDFSRELDERARTITQRVSVCLAAIHQVISVELSLARSVEFLPLGSFGLEAVGEGVVGAVSCIFGKARVAP